MTKQQKVEKALVLNDDWRILSDNTCFTLQRKRVGGKGNSKGKEIWMNYGYHTRLDVMFETAAEYIAIEDWPDLGLIIKKIDDIRSIVSCFMKYDVKPTEL